jgi:hypothetical protein
MSRTKGNPARNVHTRPFAHGSMSYGHLDINAPLVQPDLAWARTHHCLAGALGERYLRSFGGAPMRSNDIEENWLRKGERPGSRVLFEALLQAEVFPDDELANWTALTLGSFHRFLAVTSVEASAAADALDDFERTQLILSIADTLAYLAHPITPEMAAEWMQTMRGWGMPVIDVLKTGVVVLADESEEAA